MGMGTYIEDSIIHSRRSPGGRDLEQEEAAARVAHEYASSILDDLHPSLGASIL